MQGKESSHRSSEYSSDSINELDYSRDYSLREELSAEENNGCCIHVPPIPETAEQVRSKVKSSLLEGSIKHPHWLHWGQRPAVHGFPPKVASSAITRRKSHSTHLHWIFVMTTEVNCLAKLAAPVMTRTTQITHLHWLVCDHSTSISYLFPARIFGLFRKHPPLKNSVQYSLGWGGEGKFCGLLFEVMIHVKSDKDFSPFCPRLRKEEGISHRLLTSWC